MTKYSKTSRRRTRGRGRGRAQRRRRTQRGGRVGDIGEYLNSNGEEGRLAGGRKRTQRGGQNPPWHDGRIVLAGGRGRRRTQRGGQNPPGREIALGGGRGRTQRGGLRPIEMTTAAHNDSTVIPFGS